VGAKRDYYAELGIPEYWRFDETGEFHGTRLAGDRLVNGQYQPMLIEELPGGVLQGYSAALNLNLRWDNGQLVWHDPATRQRIVTLDDERQARLSEQSRADNAEVRADNEQQQRIQAEARLQQLEAELDRLRSS
jgi:multidrug efflux pump subunit AcrA (membrane-fusion protein)